MGERGRILVCLSQEPSHLVPRPPSTYVLPLFKQETTHFTSYPNHDFKIAQVKYSHTKQSGCARRGRSWIEPWPTVFRITTSMKNSTMKRYSHYENEATARTRPLIFGMKSVICKGLSQGCIVISGMLASYEMDSRLRSSISAGTNCRTAK